jgi:uncharacterized protein
MDFPVRNNEGESRFECDVDGRLSVIEYEAAPDKIIFTHTEVPEELGGRGIAGKMAAAALDHARQHNLRVVPLCEYVAKYIERHPEYRDLVANG